MISSAGSSYVIPEVSSITGVSPLGKHIVLFTYTLRFTRSFSSTGTDGLVGG